MRLGISDVASRQHRFHAEPGARRPSRCVQHAGGLVVVPLVLLASAFWVCPLLAHQVISADSKRWGSPRAHGLAVAYRMCALPKCGGVGTFGPVMNNRGDVAMFVMSALAGRDPEVRGILLRGGHATNLGPDVMFYAMNDRGALVGSVADPAGGMHAALFVDGRWHVLPGRPSLARSFACSVNGRGDTLVVMWAGAGTYVWHAGSLRAVGGDRFTGQCINARGTVGGVVCPGMVATLSSGGLRRLPVGRHQYAQVTGLNGAGDVTGYFGDPGLPKRAFITEGRCVALLEPWHRRFFTDSVALNSAGDVVGTWGTEPLNGSVFLYHARRVFELAAASQEASNWTRIDIRGMNDAGWICGDGMYHGRCRAFIMKRIRPGVQQRGAGPDFVGVAAPIRVTFERPR